MDTDCVCSQTPADMKRSGPVCEVICWLADGRLTSFLAGTLIRWLCSGVYLATGLATGMSLAPLGLQQWWRARALLGTVCPLLVSIRATTALTLLCADCCFAPFQEPTLASVYVQIFLGSSLSPFFSPSFSLSPSI